MTREPKPSRDARDGDLDDEIQSHLAMAAAERIARGESPRDAIAAARREFGNVGHVKEVTRETWGGMRFERLLQDLRYAWRSLRRSPGFAAVAIGTLALGIGATAAMFTVVNGVLVRPLPFDDPNRLVIASYEPERGPFINRPGMDEAHFLEYGRFARTVESVTAFNEVQATLTGAGEATRLRGASVTASFFSVLGVRPAYGRAFSPDEGAPGHDAVLISDALWRTRFGGERSAIGGPIMLDGVRRTIVGVLPPAFDFPFGAQVWLPIAITVNPHETRLRPVAARLAPGATETAALAELKSIVARLPAPSFGQNEQFIPEILPIRSLIVGDVRRSLYIFAGAVLFVLLIACANVANLLLMRATTRRHEMAVRIALGADRARLVRQLLTESVLMACVGGVIGVVLAFVGVRALVAIAPAGLLPRTNEIHVDGFVLAFTAALCLLTGIGFGLLPALQTSKRNLSTSIGEGGRAVSGGRSVLRGVLVMAEVALALVLLAGAGLVARSFAQLRAVELGFQPEHVLSMTVDLSPTKYASPPAMHGFRDATVARLVSLPGVSAAAAVNWRPLGRMLTKGTFVVDDGRTLTNGAGWASKPAVTPGYFRAMGIRVLEGRDFTDADRASAPGVVIASATVAKRLWPGQSAVGRRVSMADHPTKPSDWLTIVGVVDDVIQEGLKSSRDAALYQPLAQLDNGFFLTHLNFVVRSSGEPDAAMAAMRDVIQTLDGEQPIESLGKMSSLISSTVAEPLFHVRLLTLVSACALLLAAIGIYGVLAYIVTERTREIGIRVAMGAVPRDVVRMVVRRTLALTVPGVLIGLIASFALTRVLSGFLFQVKPTDPGTFIGVGALLVVVALVASIVPARRAARVDPLIALRQE